METIVLLMLFEAIIASIVVIVNSLMVFIILKNSVLRHDVSLSILLYLLISEGLFSLFMIVACAYQIPIIIMGKASTQITQSWCLLLIFPPSFTLIRSFFPFCNAFVSLEKLVMILWPTFHRSITHLHIHKAMLGQLLLISSIMSALIIYWSQVNDVKTSILCSSGAYPSLINRVDGTINIAISSLAMFFYVPVLFQIKKFVDRSQSVQCKRTQAYYLSFVRAAKWTTLIILSMIVFNLLPDICKFLQLDIYQGYEFSFFLLTSAKPLFNTFVIGMGNRDVQLKIRQLFCKTRLRQKSIAWEMGK